MIKHIYDRSGIQLIRKEDGTPKHGEDYCDACGDCLDCCAEDKCIEGGEHFWVEYDESICIPIPKDEEK